MTSDPRKQSPEQSLEKDLEEIRVALAGQDTHEPPELLDQAVLNTARRELANTKSRWPRRLSLRWMGAFATASVVVLALGIIVQQEQEISSLGNTETDQAAPMAEEPLREQEAREESRLKPERLDRDDAVMKRAAPVASAPAPATSFAAKEMADEPAELDEKVSEDRTPEGWISLMLELQASGRNQELAEELASFRSVYPDYPLPPELDR